MAEIPDSPDISQLPSFTRNPLQPAIAQGMSQQPLGPPIQPRSRLKEILQSGLAAMGSAMLKDAGLETPEEKQQRLIVNQQRQQALSNEAQKIAELDQYRKLQIMLGMQGLQTKENVAETQAGARTQAAQIGATGRVQAAQVTQQGKTPNAIELWRRALGGDQEAKAILQGIQQEKIAQAKARGEAYNQSRVIATIDPTTGEMSFEPAGQAVARGSAPVAQGVQVMSKEAQIGEIKGGVQQLRSSIQNLDREFSPEQRAKLTLALRNPTPNIISNLITSLGGTENLTQKQQDFIIALNQAHERILSLRQIAGMGRGNLEQQRAIQDTLPSVVSADRNYALKQLDAVDNQIDILHKGIPKLGRTGGSKPSAPKGSAPEAEFDFVPGKGLVRR